jgi:hypothetical protein
MSNKTLVTIIAIATVTTAVMAQTRPRGPVMITADPDTDPCGVGVVEVLDSRDDGFLDVSFG